MMHLKLCDDYLFRHRPTIEPVAVLSQEELEKSHHNSPSTDSEDLESNTTNVDGYSSPAPSGPASSAVNARMISDATIGLADGLTVPFALTAGLSALGSSRVVKFGGLAELIAGAISMGLGGYLGAKSEMYV